MSFPLLKSSVPAEPLRAKDDVLKRVKITKGVTDLQKNILKLAYERLIQGEALSCGEILIVLYGWRPEKTAPGRGQRLSLEEALIACRLEPSKYFHFSDQVERDKYHLAQASVSQTVARLVKTGLVMQVRTERVSWPYGDPRVNSNDYDQMLRLTEEGEKIVKLFPKPDQKENFKE